MSSEKQIKASARLAQKTLKEYTLFEDIQIVFKDRFQEDIDLDSVFKAIENRIPRHLLRDLDIIYVGDFPQLKARNVESAFMNGAIFISNLIADADTLLKSIAHEIAHNVESVYGAETYGDHKVIEEFISKRKLLKDILENQKLFCDERLYIQFDYSKTFDEFLYKTVGYDKLAQLTTKLYISPYAATSLREYFANGFEHYFVDENPKYLKSVSPKLYNKISSLTKMED